MARSYEKVKQELIDEVLQATEPLARGKAANRLVKAMVEKAKYELEVYRADAEFGRNVRTVLAELEGLEIKLVKEPTESEDEDG